MVPSGPETAYIPIQQPTEGGATAFIPPGARTDFRQRRTGSPRLVVPPPIGGPFFAPGQDQGQGQPFFAPGGEYIQAPPPFIPGGSIAPEGTIFQPFIPPGMTGQPFLTGQPTPVFLPPGQVSGIYGQPTGGFIPQVTGQPQFQTVPTGGVPFFPQQQEGGVQFIPPGIPPGTIQIVPTGQGQGPIQYFPTGQGQGPIQFAPTGAVPYIPATTGGAVPFIPPPQVLVGGPEAGIEPITIVQPQQPQGTGQCITVVQPP